MKERTDNRVEITEFDENVVLMLLEFVYTGLYRTAPHRTAPHRTSCLPWPFAPPIRPATD